VEGPNDFASMEEVVFRRFKRQTEEQQPLPQLIVIDGGKGQLSSAVNALEKLSLRGKISIIGIAKRLEEIYFPEDAVPLYINKNSETLKIIQQLRDEAHRFGITFHRNKRSKTRINSELSNIQGIGVKTTEKLLQRFKSVKHIREVSKDELIEEIGRQKAEIIYNYLHSQ
jgi:excinuclease ABC subunit C